MVQKLTVSNKWPLQHSKPQRWKIMTPGTNLYLSRSQPRQYLLVAYQIHISTSLYIKQKCKKHAGILCLRSPFVFHNFHLPLLLFPANKPYYVSTNGSAIPQNKNRNEYQSKREFFAGKYVNFNTTEGHQSVLRQLTDFHWENVLLRTQL